MQDHVSKYGHNPEVITNKGKQMVKKFGGTIDTLKAKPSKFKIVNMLKKKIKDSKIQDELNNYDITPSEELQRKIDYYITPYSRSYQVHKWMTFDDEEKSKIPDKKTGFIDNSPIETKDYISDKNWTKLRNLISSIDEKQAKGLNRFIHIKDNYDDYMTKLDLIDSHPNEFIKNGPPKLNKFELEQLRILKNADKNLFR